METVEEAKRGAEVQTQRVRPKARLKVISAVSYDGHYNRLSIVGSTSPWAYF